MHSRIGTVDPRRPSTDLMLAHQPRHTIPAHPYTLLAQRALNPRTSVCLTAVGVNVFDMLQ